MKVYQEYKTSDVDWIGRIPSHWRMSRVKFLCNGNPEYGLSINSEVFADSGVRFIRTTDIDDNGNLFPDGVYLSPEDVDKSYLLKDGDFLISRSGTIGRSYIHKSNGKDASWAGYLIRFQFANSETARFIYWFTKSGLFQIWLDQNRVESTISNVNAQKYANLPVALPVTEDEIAKINFFLDRKTAQIDTLIEKKQQQIELLQEQRTALIIEASTKGLNANAPMKDSGVEWLGQIPSHWELVKTKYLFRLVADQAPENNEMELLSLYTEIGVRPRKDLEARGNKASTTDGYWMVQKGDIIVNKLLAWMGAVGYSEYDGVTSPAYDVLRKTVELNSKYYHYLLRCGIYLPEFKRRSTGIMEMRLRLYFDELGQIQLVYPPVEEQNQIVQYLDDLENDVLQTVSKINREIELLQEYRTALISEAVTGKVDVRTVHE
jgi:type I restriction enzyme S subunit